MNETEHFTSSQRAAMLRGIEQAEADRASDRERYRPTQSTGPSLPLTREQRLAAMERNGPLPDAVRAAVLGIKDEK